MSIQNRNAVLVIDDDPDFRQLMRMVVEMEDLNFFEAPDCCAGVTVLETERAKIGIVFLDYFMPGMTPAECTASILRIAGSDVLTVLTTAVVDPAGRANELGISKWLSKPLNFTLLEELLYDVKASRSALGLKTVTSE
jgi:response regulator RpfG family c-di-GMP phosphodiesterase